MANKLNLMVNQNFLLKIKAIARVLIQDTKTKETYQFQLDYFPGKVFAHLIEPTTVSPVENLPFTQHELKYKAEIWLLLEFDSLLLNNLTSAIEQQLKQRWQQSLDRPFNPDETDAAWQIAFSQFLRIQAEKVGLYGLKIGTRILKQTLDNQLVFGQKARCQLLSMSVFPSMG